MSETEAVTSENGVEITVKDEGKFDISIFQDGDMLIVHPKNVPALIAALQRAVERCAAR